MSERDDKAEVAYVAIGSNLGDRAEWIAMARRALESLPATRLVAASDVEETAPLGDVEQGEYLNQIVALETSLTPRALLAELQRIERENGRVRTVRWGPRTMDLDIVAYDDTTVTEPDLVVPHPELPNRDFWQRELAQVRRAARAGAR